MNRSKIAYELIDALGLSMMDNRARALANALAQSLISGPHTAPYAGVLAESPTAQELIKLSAMSQAVGQPIVWGVLLQELDG